MASNKVYILRTGQLSSIDNRFHYYHTEVYSSKKRLMESVNHRIKENKAVDVERDDHRENDLFIDYSCEGVEGSNMRGRYHIMEKAIK